MMKNPVLKRLAALAALALATGFAGQASAQLTVVSFGGSYQEAQSKSLFVPAAKALGLTCLGWLHRAGNFTCPPVK